MKKLLNSTLLVIISIVLVTILSLITFAYKTIRSIIFLDHKGLSDYYMNAALSGDQTGNAFCAPLLNLLTRKPGPGYDFGNRDETVSSALGKNKKLNALNKFGLFIGKVLNKLDPNHLEKSIDKTV